MNLASALVEARSNAVRGIESGNDRNLSPLFHEAASAVPGLGDAAPGPGVLTLGPQGGRAVTEDRGLARVAGSQCLLPATARCEVGTIFLPLVS